MILIKTQLAEGISPQGEKDPYIERKYNTNPRNLLLAIRERPKISEENTQGYGDIGHCGTWIEVDGVEMTSDDLNDFEHETDPSNFRSYSHISEITKTQWAKKFISEINDLRSGLNAK